MRSRQIFALAAAMMLLVTGAAGAQSRAASLIASARRVLEAPDPDAAAVLLERALEPGLGATTAEQTRAWTLYGIAHLMRDNSSAARSAFRQALQREPSLRVDSLAFLSDVLESEFNLLRGTVAPGSAAPAPGLFATLELPRDTTLTPGAGALPLTARANVPARVIIAIYPAEAPLQAVWADTTAAGTSVHWPARRADGTPVRSGRYVVRVSASDSTGRLAPVVERAILISRGGVDPRTATPPPPGPPASPESARRRPGSPLWLAGGLALGATSLVYIDPARRAAEVGKQPVFGPRTYRVLTFGSPVVGAVLYWRGRHSVLLDRSILSNRERQLTAAAGAAAWAVAMGEPLPLPPPLPDSVLLPEARHSELWLSTTVIAGMMAAGFAKANLEESAARRIYAPAWTVPLSLGVPLAGVALYRWGPKNRIAANVAANARLRAADARLRAAIADINARVAHTPLRIRVEGISLER